MMLLIKGIHMGKEKDRKFHTVRGYELIQDEHKLLTSAMEDYLEMIYRETEKEEFIRLNYLADRLNVQASSATKMVQKLASLGYANYERYGIISLTAKGKDKGKYLLNRHKIIESFLQNIGVKENLLRETELIEHNISATTLVKIESLNQLFENQPELLIKLGSINQGT